MPAAIEAGMRKLPALALAVLAAVPSVARADRDEAIANLLGPLGDAIRWTQPTPGWNGGADEILGVRANCREAIADAKKEGVRPDDEITAWKGFEVNPKAKVSGDKVTVKFKDVGWYCDDLEKRTKHWDLILRVKDAMQWKDKVAAGMTDDEKKNVMPEMVTDAASWATRCKDSLAAEQASGATSIDVDGQTISLTDAGAMCGVLDQYAQQRKAAWQARIDLLGPKYKAAGIKGDRLELFVYYESVGDDWYLAGCKKTVKDPKGLARARVLFQWLGSEDAGDIMVRRFAFSGDKVSITDAHYDTEARAYAGCR